jgi:hypothetical protein
MEEEKSSYLLVLSSKEMEEWKQLAKERGLPLINLLKLGVKSLNSKWDNLPKIEPIKKQETPKKALWNEEEEKIIKEAEKRKEEVRLLAEKWGRLTDEQRLKAHNLMMKDNYSLEEALNHVKG